MVKGDKIEYVKKYYDAISTFKINIPTPIMNGVRTPLRQFASCVLVDTDDTLDSIFSSDMAIGKYVAQTRNGIGINAGRIRTWFRELEKSNILELSHSLRSLNQLLNVAPKMVSEEESSNSSLSNMAPRSQTFLS